MTDLLGLTLNDLKNIVREKGYQGYVATQISDWLYKKYVTDCMFMTNLSLNIRKDISGEYYIGAGMPSAVQVSKDGTKKYLFDVGSTYAVESAWIPGQGRNTLCVSSQVGCKMGCRFCMTGKQGFQKNLTSGQIINQIISLPERDTLTNVVYMGMGEPFDNIDAVLDSLSVLTSEWGFGWSPTRITVSTIGLIPAMERFLSESKCHLAISLHSPFDEERRELMPVQKVYPAKEVIQALKPFDFSGQRRLSFEYILFGGVNDTPEHAKAVAGILKGLKCRVNLINFHPFEGSGYKPSKTGSVLAFQEILEKKGIITTIRVSRGMDINAACGMLSTKKAKIKPE